MSTKRDRFWSGFGTGIATVVMLAGGMVGGWLFRTHREAKRRKEVNLRVVGELCQFEGDDEQISCTEVVGRLEQGSSVVIDATHGTPGVTEQLLAELAAAGFATQVD